MGLVVLGDLNGFWMGSDWLNSEPTDVPIMSLHNKLPRHPTPRHAWLQPPGFALGGNKPEQRHRGGIKCVWTARRRNGSASGDGALWKAEEKVEGAKEKRKCQGTEWVSFITGGANRQIAFRSLSRRVRRTHRTDPLARNTPAVTILTLVNERAGLIATLA